MIIIDSKNIGAELVSIRKDGVEKLHDGKEYWQRHSPILFPIVGQLKNGKTIIEGNEFKMGQHGFARDMEFELLEKNDNMHKYVLKSNDKTKEFYPYNFELYVTYLVENNTIKTKYEVINTDNKEIIFGLGGHPAYKCDYKNEEYEIIFNDKECEIEFLKLENGLISDKKGKNIMIENNIKILNDTFIDDAIIMKNVKSKSVVLLNCKTGEKNLEFHFEGFKYLALWSKPNAPFICIEPWLNTSDYVTSNKEFNQKKDIIRLPIGEKFESEYYVEFY